MNLMKWIELRPWLSSVKFLKLFPPFDHLIYYCFLLNLKQPLFFKYLIFQISVISHFCNDPFLPLYLQKLIYANRTMNCVNYFQNMRELANYLTNPCSFNYKVMNQKFLRVLTKIFMILLFNGQLHIFLNFEIFRKD